MLRTRSVRLSRIGPCVLRLRAGAQPHDAGAAPAQPAGARAQHPRLCDRAGYPAHGGALGLRAASLFAAAARGNGCRHGADLSASGYSGAVQPRSCADARPARLGDHGDRVPADTAVLPAVAAMGAFSARDRARLHGLYPRLRLSICPQARRHVERPHSVERERRMMTDASVFRSGKTHRDENFPVASWLIQPRHRTLILAFYAFVRCADDIADHATLSASEKLNLLDRLEQDLLGAGDGNAQAVALRRALAVRGMSPRHAQDLLKAFRLDATKLRYRDWDNLMGYCAYSAMPVGRFVLDVHGESRNIWPASDAICGALQVINHIQDCAADYRNLDRVYIPLDALAACGLGVEALGAPKASPELLRCLAGLAERTGALLQEGAVLPNLVKDWRLALEISVIQTLAQHLTRILTRRDPLSERVHLGKLGVAGVSLFAVLKGVTRRAGLHHPTSAAQP